MNPLVSIIIPCYNSQQWLAETIESALSQTWTNKEIIVVNDGSTDNSLAVAKSFESSKVKIISQENKGASAARNVALKTAQGDFIQYLDADDLLAPDKIERQLMLLTHSYLEYVACGEWARFYRSFKEAKFISEAVWRSMKPIDWLVCSWLGGGMMHPASWLISHLIVEKAGLWNENLSLNDDGEYFCRVVLASKGVIFCDKAKSYYRSGILGSLSGLKSRTAKESEFKSLKLSTNYLLTEENSVRTRRACATKFQRFIYSTYPDFSDLVRESEIEVSKLGGSNLPPSGGRMYHFMASLIVWKFTQVLQKTLYSFLFRSLVK